ncbi:tumor necrosis factor receptor superfamily member 27 isoform X1 [Oncorhynchus clarkii lewisi]|uniref:tumor necrosis factor receptor superfamily member 27 isoform X1 n=2 Tax=Oncorhynchus clarkii lewisi TaxID=490388 RepID=UPI0039B90C7B
MSRLDEVALSIDSVLKYRLVKTILKSVLKYLRKTYGSRSYIAVMDCSETQYYLNGNCHPCLQCGPGQELSEDCGYGSGRSAYCIPCNVKTYKEGWGYHFCRFCQSCKRINRHQKSLCTSKSNAVCGECLPGFYSKTRINGLQDLECMPCGPSSTTEQQCSRSREVDVEKVWSPEGPAHNAAVTATISVALVTMAILAAALFIYFRHTLLKKIFKGCLAPQSTSQNDMECAAYPVNRVTLNLEQEGQGSGACANSTTTAETLARLQSKVDMIVPLGSIVLSPDLKTQDHRYLLETQPLVQNSTCSNCSSGFVSQISSEPPSVSGDVPITMEIPVGPIDSGEYVAGSLFLQSSEGYCASELQESPLHQHVPVECTELDFHTTAASTLDLDSTTDPDCSSVSLGITEISEIRDGSSGETLGGRQLRRSPSDCPEEQTDSCWSSHQQPCNSSLRGSNAMETVSLLKKCIRIMQGVRLGRLPQALVDSLALKLDPTFPGVQNYQHVALKMGISHELLKDLRGFEQVFRYLSSCTLLTVPELLHTFYLLQRFDTLLLLCEYALQRYVTGCTY